MHSEAFLIYFVLLSEVVRRAVRYSFGALVATRVLGLVRFLRSGIEEGKRKIFDGMRSGDLDCQRYVKMAWGRYPCGCCKHTSSVAKLYVALYIGYKKKEKIHSSV